MSCKTTTLGASPPLILGFHPSKRHAALITSCDQGSIILAFTLVLLVSCDQGSIVLAFTLVLLVLKRF